MTVYLNCNAGTGKPATRLDDSVDCPIHGLTSIVSGSPDTFHNGRPAVRVGDKTACGDTIIEGSSLVFINGKPAAFLGCTTAHGGRIISGSSTIFIGTADSTAIGVEDVSLGQECNDRGFSTKFDLSDMHEAGNWNNISYINMPIEVTSSDGTHIITIRTDEFGISGRIYTTIETEVNAWVVASDSWEVVEEYEILEEYDWELGNG